MADTGWEGKHLQTKAERFVGFKRLGFQALPEFWTFQMAAGFLMKGAVCAVIPPLLYYGIYSRTQIFKDCQQLILPLLRRRKGRSE